MCNHCGLKKKNKREREKKNDERGNDSITRDHAIYQRVYRRRKEKEAVVLIGSLRALRGPSPLYSAIMLSGQIAGQSSLLSA